MKNSYTVLGDIVYIYLDSRKGEKHTERVSLNKLPKLLAFPGKFYAHKNKISRTFYAIANYKDDQGNRKQYKLHRFLLDVTDPKREVDHRDHDGLNDLDDNLVEVSHKENMQNKQKYVRHRILEPL